MDASKSINPFKLSFKAHVWIRDRGNRRGNVKKFERNVKSNGRLSSLSVPDERPGEARDPILSGAGSGRGPGPPTPPRGEDHRGVHVRHAEPVGLAPPAHPLPRGAPQARRPEPAILPRRPASGAVDLEEGRDAQHNLFPIRLLVGRGGTVVERYARAARGAERLRGPRAEAGRPGQGRGPHEATAPARHATHASHLRLQLQTG